MVTSGNTVNMQPERLAECATSLAQCRTSNRPVCSLGALQTTDAYRVQAELHRRFVAQGDSMVGYKIGCTTPVMRRFLGIDHPCAGGVRASTIRLEHADLPVSERGHIGVECEIAVEIAHTPQQRRYSVTDAGELVAAVMPAIEIVEDRYLDSSSVGVGTLIADDFFGAGCVLGPPLRDWHALDLAELGGVLTVNDVIRGEGRGADVMGHPLNALVWLVDHCAQHDFELVPGHIVLLGSLVQTQWLEPGDQVEINIEALGNASLTVFAASG